ncbi:TIGR02444 family protein [Marinobacterium rhizophilum]|uniref:TIGR02444 family protein n=1 Tax=Marinobacterium rhizophilum TaxID=420402 RepID=A0ABY5HFR2_9GAMM|nr:TIGR02444 family protein [Marinobacterium rhizophilum]UTW10959.1 TIGR02444 family protein [Marinobacterium rhizophilum]
MKLDNDLWQYALQLYGRPGVEAACLALQQESSLSVNRLLFCCWLATTGRPLLLEALERSQAAQWQHSTTEPLRALRYQVRQQRLQTPQLDSCYQALRRAELAAEQVELGWLYALGLDWPATTSAGCPDLLLQNLGCYLRSEGLEPELRLLTELQVLVQAAAGPEPARRVLQLRW